MNPNTRLLIGLLLIGKTLLPPPAYGQSYPYIVDFESGNTQPSSKSYASTDTVTINQLDWVLPGVYLGYALASDYKIGNRSCRIRLSNNTSGAPGYMCMVQDLPYGMDSLSFYTAMYGAETGGKLLLEYSTDQGASWQTAGDTIIVPDSSAPVRITRDLSISGNVRIAIRKAETSNERINIDQIRITNEDTIITDLALQTFFPAGPGINPYTRTLYGVFEDSVVLNEGEVRLQSAGGAVQTFDLSSTGALTTSGDTVFLNGSSLLPHTSYYVTFDSAAFQSMDGYKVSRGIRDSLTWTFSTASGSLTGLEESFRYCEGRRLGIFRAWNILGSAGWTCDTLRGSSAPPSVRIYAGGAGTDAETDYLISALPLDLSGMVAPQLHFMEKKEGGTDFTRAILYSTNYNGGNPHDSLVQWRPLLNMDSIGPSGTWLSRQAGLEQLVHQPFFLAFRYHAAGNSTFSGWSLDSVRITEYTSHILSPKPDRSSALQVIGEATTSEIAFRLEIGQTDTVEIFLYDLTGRCRHRERIYCQPAAGIYRICPLQLKPGLYILRLHLDSGQQYRTKTSIYR